MDNPHSPNDGERKMGIYIYRVTGELIKLADGRKAHVAKFAYKPVMSGFGNAEKANARMRFQSGCIASANMKLKSDLIATITEDGLYGRLYGNPRGLKVFYDDTTFGSEKMPALANIMRAGTRWKPDPRNTYDGGRPVNETSKCFP